MRGKPAMCVAQGKGHALRRSRSGGLTCSESQVDDVLSAGESTEEERSQLATDPAKLPIKQVRRARQLK
jgi:hypothetical protein